MITKYKTNYSDDKIEKVECIRETEKMVFLQSGSGREYRESKISTWAKYFDTWEDAHNYLSASINKKIEGIKMNLDIAEVKKLKVEEMKP